MKSKLRVLLYGTTSSGPRFRVLPPHGDNRIIAGFHQHREMKNLNVAGDAETLEFVWKWCRKIRTMKKSWYHAGIKYVLSDYS